MAVIIACILMFLLAAVEAAREVWLLISFGDSSGPIGLLVSTAILILLATFAVLGVFNLRGANPTRILTWCFLALFLLAGLWYTGNQVLALVRGIPWDLTSTVALLLNVFDFLVEIAIAVLLALPASNRFFRSSTTPSPSTMGSGPYPPAQPGFQPGQPPATGTGQPPAPGQPPPSGQPAPGQPASGAPPAAPQPGAGQPQGPPHAGH